MVERAFSFQEDETRDLLLPEELVVRCAFVHTPVAILPIVFTARFNRAKVEDAHAM